MGVGVATVTGIITLGRKGVARYAASKSLAFVGSRERLQTLANFIKGWLTVLLSLRRFVAGSGLIFAWPGTLGAIVRRAEQILSCSSVDDVPRGFSLHPQP